MKKYVLVILTLILIVQQTVAGKYASEASENPFLKGVLNSKFEGEETALVGEIIKIQTTKQKYPVYKINLNLDGIKHIWVTSIAPQPNGGIKVGDFIVFKGFISIASVLDSTGELEKIIGSKTLLMAIQSQRTK